jgi:hypothetical protein
MSINTKQTQQVSRKGGDGDGSGKGKNASPLSQVVSYKVKFSKNMRGKPKREIKKVGFYINENIIYRPVWCGK